MEVVQCRSFEKGNAGLQEWIQDELAQGEVWQRQYEMVLEHQTKLDSLLKAKSLQPLEKTTRALQKELEEMQEALRECRSCQYQLRIHKQEKENQRMAESVKELENKVFKQQQEEKSGKDSLREMRMERWKLKRHLSEWEAKWEAKNVKTRERRHLIELLSATLQELPLRSQELHRNITLLEGSMMEAQLEADLFHKEVFFGPARTPFLWDEQAANWKKRFLTRKPERTSSRGQLSSRSAPCPGLWMAWCLFWAFAKALPGLLLLLVVFRFLCSSCSSQPCSRWHWAPLLYIRPKVALPPVH